MTKPYPENEKQLLIYQEISRINQGWIAFYFVLAVVSVLTVALLYCIFWHQTTAPTSISGLLDGLFGFCLREIIKFHFPSKTTKREDKKNLPASHLPPELE
jgi:hypothetical protein